MHMLQHRRNTLQPHAGIHRGLGQRMQHKVVAAFLFIVLHEHEIPDFDVAVAIGIR